MAKDEAKTPHQQGLEELRYVQQIYQNQYNLLNNSINITLQELQESNSAQKTLESVDIIDGRELVTSIGGDFYAFSRMQNTKTFLVAVGANYLVEKDADSAKQHVADMIKKGNETLNKLLKNKKELEAALIDVSYRIDNLL